jgi:DNA-binding CsgD family transcriptional regulator/PAS domain-containing protein
MNLAILSEAIAAIWQAAAEPDRWTQAMQAVNPLMPECMGLLAHTPFAEGPGSVWKTLNPPVGFMDEYVANWQGHDTTLHAIARRMPIEHFVFDVMDPLPMVRTDIWQQLYVPHGVNDVAGVTVNGSVAGGAEAILFAAFSESRNERQSAKRREILTALIPHLTGAAALHWRLAHAESRSASTRSILDRLALGVVAMDADALVTEFNRAAKRFFDAKDGLLLSRNKIVAASRSTQGDLDRALSVVLAGGAERPLSVRRERGAPLTVIVTPPAVDTADTLGSKARAVMFISDPELVPANAGSRVAALYGLTRSEAEIAREIAVGKVISDIAKERGTSVGTARTQLKALMSKIGASRQSDVVRSILAVSVLDSR